MEVVYDPRYLYPTWNLKQQSAPLKMKRRSLMQRLSSWFEDHLPLRRRSSNVRGSERGTRRKASKSVAAGPRMRYSISNAQKQQSDNNNLIEHLPPSSGEPHTMMSISMIGKDSIFDDGYTDHHNRYHSYLDDMSVSTFSHLRLQQQQNELPHSSFNDTPLSQSFSSAYSSCRRPRIRTNPWISSSSSTTNRSNSSSKTQQQNSSSLMFRSPQPSSSLASRSVYSAPDALSSSTSKGSHQQQQITSTTTTSVASVQQHKDNSIDIENNNNTAAAIMELRDNHKMIKTHQNHSNMINDDENHIYHELESLHRLSLLLEERACSSEGEEFLSPQPTNEEKPINTNNNNDDSRTSSPIYAIPYDSQRNSLCSENPLLLPEFISKQTFYDSYENPYARIQHQPLSIESPFFQKQQSRATSNNNYAVPRRAPPPSTTLPEWHCPPPPPIDNGEVDFLAELDKQIAELQIQSDAVRQLVEEAKHRQELRERTRLLCMEHINELRKMRWFMRNNFELCL
jgi:hypothetical protein